MKKLIRSSAILGLAVASLFSLGSMADAGSHKKVVYLDYNYEPSVKPSEIFLTANSGPYLRKLNWTGWGTSKAVGRGQYVYNCASCIPHEKKPVTITFHKLINCKFAPNLQIYRYGLIHVIDPSKKRFSKWNGSCPPAGWRN